MKHILLTCSAMLVVSLCVAQDANYTNYNVNWGNGNGLRFWSGSDYYKIHMGNSAEYQFGPVADYAIKMNMSADANRGWVWGVAGGTPVAALSNAGIMQIAGQFTSLGHLGVGTSNPYNPQGWNRVIEVYGPQHSKILATSASQSIRVGMFSHSSWNGGGGFLGTESNHKLLFMTNESVKAVLTTGGAFGIGTETPTQALDVVGMVAINGVKVINTNNSANGQDIYINGRVIRNESTVHQDGMYVNYEATGGASAHLRFYANGQTERMRIDAATGNVGIGTTAPDEKLAVKGKIHSQEVRIDLTGAMVPDYVFAKDYKLPSLETVKAYIDQHHHLPEVPSASEIDVNGANLGEMNMILLKKIEELTLYMIDMKEENDLLKKEVESIKSKINNK